MPRAVRMVAQGHNRTHAQPQILSLIDHLVGPRLQRERHRQAKRLGCLHVGDQLELCRLLDWEVTWFGALQNPRASQTVRPLV
jgi:hypothetical protein